MHWLKQFRKDYIREDGGKGISCKELAAMVRTGNTGCSDVLIAILEGGGITHPGIAQRIAKVTGCTAEQYNSMVHKCHRGNAEPAPKRRPGEFSLYHKPRPEKAEGATDRGFARPVVQLDLDGMETARFDSISAAARLTGCSMGMIKNRCSHILSAGADEFRFYGFTFRHADEWDTMNAAQRADAIRSAQPLH